MSLVISYNKASGAEEAFQMVKKHLNPDLMAKFKVKADFEYFPDEPAPRIKATGKGFTLTMIFGENEATVDLDVSLFLRAVKGPVLSKIEKMLNSAL